MDFNEITPKRRYGPASVSDVNTRWRSWFEDFNFRRNRTGMCIKTGPSKTFAVPIFFPVFPRPAFMLESWQEDLQCAASCHVLEWPRHGSDESDFLSILDSASLLGLLAKIKV